ncbi:NUDIX hydrolase [Ktedonospora formicarum]|uniref:NUDIX hydrolase n=1 Tax=Ktedonospora formicarum TaxID=2778364 RepID=A0A8J3MQ70_9CHLR|nr:NUDIX hydrolase [Ktedonospora formicarum]GHO42461.1 NUDIX hydrolase [Ktedonospora formicarum]
MPKDLAPWQVVDSRISYEDPWLRIRTDTCKTAQGHIIESYHVLEALPWVNVIALTTEGKIVLVREYRHGARQILLGLPGGAVEPSDRDPLAAIQRELREETGYSGGEFFQVGQSYANPANQGNIVYAFLALGVTQTREQELDENEYIEIVHQDFNAFRRKAWSGEIALQSLYLATLGLTEHFIQNSNHPSLRAIRDTLLS